MDHNLKWVTVPNWHCGYHLGYADKAGLYRVDYLQEVVAIGQASSGLAARLRSLSRRPKTGDSDFRKLLYHHRAEVVMQVAVLDLSPEAITELRDRLIDKHLPSWIKRVVTPRGQRKQGVPDWREAGE